MSGKIAIIEKAVITLAIISVLIPIAIFSSVLPKATVDNCKKEAGLVSGVINGAGKRDIVIEIQGDKKYYYINRAAEHGLSVNWLSDQILNNRVELMTINHFSLLDPTGSTKHIAKITKDGVVIYSEI